MIWLAVFPTLLVLNLSMERWLSTMSPFLRTFVLTTIAVPIVIYLLMPLFNRLRRWLVNRNAKTWTPPDAPAERLERS